MTALNIIDLVARGGAGTLLLLWCAVLLRDHRSVLSAKVVLAMNLSIICYCISVPVADGSQRGLVQTFADAASILSPALFWLFARTWFDDQARIGWRSWLLVALFGALPVAQLIIHAMTGSYSIAIWMVVRLGMFGFGIAGMWLAWRGRANDLVEARRAFRLMLVWTIGGFVLWVNVDELLIRSGLIAANSRSLMQTAIFLVTFIASVGLYGLRAPDLFAAPLAPTPKPPPPPSTDERSALVQRLRHVMHHDRAYRAEGFTIAALANAVGEAEYRVRRAINGELGFRNFTAFLNSYRLTEVVDALADPAQRDVPILIIALDAGFGSMGPFNRAFREAQGVTPSEYRQHALAGAGNNA